jgi:hypothetical protein
VYVVLDKNTNMENFNFKKYLAEGTLTKENLGMSMEKIVDALLDTNDGPIGPRSVIYRALEGAQYKQASLDDLADAVLEALEIMEQNGGSLDSTEFR